MSANIMEGDMTEEYIRLQEISSRRIRETSLDIHRGLFDQIDWRERIFPEGRLNMNCRDYPSESFCFLKKDIHLAG